MQGLQDLFERFPQEMKDLRETLFEDLGEELLKALRGRIGGAGKVQRWQDKYVGSRMGYAAVRPKSGETVQTLEGTQYAVGRVTNAITSGHKVRGPSGKAKRYRPRRRMSEVPGKLFYHDAQWDAERLARQAAEKLGKQMGALFEEAEG